MYRFAIILAIAVIIASTKRDISSTVATANPISTKDLMNTVYADTSVATTLQLSKQLSNIIEINIKQKQQVCIVKSFQPQPQQYEVLSVKLNQTIINKQWNSEIIASVSNNLDNKTYVLLDNGTIIETKLASISHSISSININKLYSYQAIGSTNIWLTNKYQLFLLGIDLYVLQNELFSKIQLHPQGFWQKDSKTIRKHIISAKQVGDFIFILSSKDLYKITKSTQTLIYKGIKLIDFTLTSQTIYILDEEDGLISLDIDKQRQAYIYNLQQPSKTKNIQAIDNTIFIIYQLQKRNYLAQYFIKDAQIVLNRYYYNFYSIKSLHLHQHYGIIDSYNEFTIFRHSINRNSFNDLTQVESIYKSHGAKIININLLQNKQDLSFIITFKDKMVTYKFKTNSKQQSQHIYGMNTLKIQCYSNKSAQYLIQIIYKGICSQFEKYNSKSFLCQEQIPILFHFQYNHNRKRNDQELQHLINSLILLVLIAFSCLMIYSKLQKICKMHDRIRQLYNKVMERRSTNQAQAEQTFNNDLK